MEKQEQRSVEPRQETLNVELANELADVSHCVRGFYRPEPSKKPPQKLLDELHPILPEQEVPTLITLYDRVPFDGTFPGGAGNYERWDLGVAELVRKNTGKAVQYEVVLEPDNPARFKGTRHDFFELYEHTAKLLRELDPKATIVGPSISRQDGGYIAEFLKVCKEYDVLPDVLTWNEPSPRTDLSGHVGWAEENLWQDGSPVQNLRASQATSIDYSNSPANVIFFVTDIEKAHRENAFRRLHVRYGFKLSHLVDNESRPRSNFFAYQAYCQMHGKMVKVNGSSTVSGMATWDKDNHSGTILLARARARQGQIKPETPPLGKVTLEIKQVKSPWLRVSALRLTGSGDGASNGFEEAFTGQWKVNGEQVRIGLASFDEASVYLLRIAESPGPQQH